MSLFELDSNSIESKIKVRLAESFKENFNFKERFNGMPKSVMEFNKSPELMSLIEGDKSELNDVTQGKAKNRGGGYAKEMKYSTYNPDQAYFIIDYYTKRGDIILDPFSGRGTRPVITSLLERNYIGYDTSEETINHNRRLLMKLPYLNATLIHGDGTSLSGIKDRNIDAVFTCPPYYDKEVYSGEPGDLSHMKYSEFDSRIDNMFQRLSQVVKYSNYKTKEFHPVIITVGTHRQGEKGFIDMEHVFTRLAESHGFVLHDKLITVNRASGQAFVFRRNYEYGFLTKTHETTLVYLIYNK
jgi:DNA modification methylase